MSHVYVSIAGLVLHSALHWPRFALHAGASMAQALSAAGNRSAEARQIGEVHHTLSVRENHGAMLHDLRAGAHLRAMRVFTKIGHGKTFGSETDTPPRWQDVPGLYEEHATLV